MKVLSLLKRGWCQRGYAKDAKNFECNPRAPQAVQWCLIGAIENAFDSRNHRMGFRDCLAREIYREQYPDLVDTAYLGEVPEDAITAYNDGLGRTLDEILTVTEAAEKKFHERFYGDGA